MVRDVFVDELSRSRRETFSSTDGAGWTQKTSVRDSGIGLDSLERFTLAARLNETFHLYRSGVEDNLLRAATLGDTVEIIQAGLAESAEGVSFYSGGSTGAPHIISHTAVDLLREVEELVQLFSDRRRVIVTVPVHHIYGFLFGVLLPREMGVPAFDAQHSLLSGERRPRAGDLIVSTPFLWQRLIASAGQWGPDIMGSSSTAPLSEDVADGVCRGAVDRGGVDRLIEVYGSSETAGVGWRDRCGPSRHFTLFSRWERVDDVQIRTGDRAVHLPDWVTWYDDRAFLPAGRRDAVVQVGGVNVNLDDLRNTILQVIPEARDCALRLSSDERIRAYLALQERLINEREITERLRAHLPDVALPRSITVGASLPRTPTGKIADW